MVDIGAIVCPVKVTETPGRTFPSGSLTVPVMFPVLSWAIIAVGKTRHKKTKNAFFNFFLSFFIDSSTNPACGRIGNPNELA